MARTPARQRALARPGAAPLDTGRDRPGGGPGEPTAVSAAARRFSDLTSHVVAFCRRLRLHGLPVGPREAADALRGLSAVDVGDRRECYLALRTVLTSRKDELHAFDPV